MTAAAASLRLESAHAPRTAAAALRAPASSPRVGAAGHAQVTTLRAHKCSRQRVYRGEMLHCAGESFRSLYVVRVGFLKRFTISDDGLQQVIGFAMPGDVVGLDAIHTGVHQSAVVALEDTEVFVVPFGECERRSQESASGQRLLLRTLAQEILRSHELMMVLGTMHAEQRVATFLLDLSERYGRLGYSRAQFVLRMTREDIGSYLGVKLETVSRLLSRFSQEGLLQVRGKSIALLDLPGLARIAGLSPDHRRHHGEPLVSADGELLVS